MQCGLARRSALVPDKTKYKQSKCYGNCVPQPRHEHLGDSQVKLDRQLVRLATVHLYLQLLLSLQTGYLLHDLYGEALI